MQKRIITFLSAVCMLCFSLSLQAQDWRATTPYQYGFDNATENAIWMLISSNDTTAHNKWYIGSAVDNGTFGNNALFISADSGSTHSYDTAVASSAVAYRDFHLLAGEYIIEYDWKSMGENRSDYLMVALIPDTIALSLTENALPRGFSSMTLPQGCISLSGTDFNMGLTGASVWNHQMQHFMVPSEGNYRLAFFWVNDENSGDNPPAAVDNIDFRTVTCFQPTNLTATQDVHSITLNWTSAGSESAWVIDGNDTTYLANTTSFTINNLTPRTVYTFSVRAICSAGDTSFGASITTGTGVEIPYFEDFENMDVASYGGIPLWSYILTGDSAHSTSEYAPQLSGSSQSGNHSLQLRGFGYTILPIVDQPADTLQLSFTHSANIASSMLEVGVMEGSTFVPLDTISNTTGSRERIVYLMNYTGTSRSIAFRNSSTSPTAQSATHYIDNLRVDYLPSCFPVASTSVAADSVSAIISWTPQFDATSWYVEVLDEEGTVVNDTLCTTPSVTFSSLQPNSAFGYRVRSYCAEGDTSTALGGSFRTLCVAVPNSELPYTYSFEAGDSRGYCWKGYSNSFFTPSESYSASHSGNYGLSFNSTADNYSYMVLPLFEAPVNALMVSLYMGASRNSVDGQMIIGVMDDPADFSTFTGVDTVHSNGTTMQLYELPLTNYTGTGRNIAILCDSGAVHNFFIDDVTVEPTPTCSKVHDLEVPIVTAGAALARWSNGRIGDYTGAHIEYRDTLSESWLSVNTNGLEQLITNMNHNLCYEIRVAAMCSGNNMSQYVNTFITTAMTTCNEIDSLTTWNDTLSGFSSSSHYEIPVHNWYNYSFTEQLFTVGELDTAGSVSAIDFFYDDTLHSMTAKDSCLIYMGISDGNSINARNFIDPSQMTLVYSGPLNCTYGWNTFAFNQGFFNYDGRHNLVVAVVDNSGESHDQTYRFRCHNASGKAITLYSDEHSFDNYILMDYQELNYRNDMVLHFAECGNESECFPPMIFVESIGVDSISVSLIPGAYETGWTLYAQEMGNSMHYVGSTSQHHYTFHGLNPSTTYTLRILGECEDSMYSDVTVTTRCLAQPAPFYEDFGGWPLSASPIVPPCWYKYYSNGENVPYVSSYRSRGDGKALFLYSAASSYSFVALPEMQPSVDSLQLNFWVYRENNGGNNNYPHSVVVGVMADVNDIESFVVIDTVTPDVANVWQYVELPLNSFMDDSTLSDDQKAALRHGRITLLSPDSTYNYPYIDDIEIDYIPRCARPTGLVHLSYPASDTMLIGWDFMSDNLGYFVSDGTHQYFTTANTFYLPNLNGSMMYDISVRQYCGEMDNNHLIVWSDTSDAITASFRTNCGAITKTPWIEGFEGVNPRWYFDSVFSTCWTRISDSVTYFGVPYVSDDNDYNGDIHTGYRGIAWDAMTSSMYGDRQYIITPPIDTDSLPINSLQVKFWARSKSNLTTPRFTVGVMSDRNDTNSFVAVETVTIPGITEWREYTVYLNNYVGNGSYIAFKVDRPQSSWSASIDDIVIGRMPNCPPVSNITAVDIDTALIRLTWTENGTATAWDVEYGPQGFTPGNGTFAYVTSLPFTASALTSNTTYEFRIKPACTEDINPVVVAFTTVGGYLTVPFYCDFTDEGINSLWEFSNGTNVNAWYIGTATGNGDSNALYISNDNGVNHIYNPDSTCVSFAYVNLLIPDTGYYYYSYDWKCRGQANIAFDYMRAAIVPISVDVEAGEETPTGFSITNLPQGWIAIDNGSMLNESIDWTNQTDEFHIDHPGFYRMMFVWVNDRHSMGHQPPAAIDNIVVRRNSCLTPVDLGCEVFSDSVFFYWNSNGDNTHWLVSVGDSTFMTDHPFTPISGLLPNQDYTLSVRTFCFPNDTSLAATLAIHTDCYPIAVPYYENFDNITTSTTAVTGVLMPCWNYIPSYSYDDGSLSVNAVKPTIFYNSSIASSGNYSLRFRGIGYVTLPPVDMPLNRIKVNLTHFTNASDATLEIGVMDDGVFIPMGSISDQEGSHVSHTFPFTNYNGNSRTIAFYNIDPDPQGFFQQSIQFIDDLSIEELPICMPVSNIHSSYSSTTEILLDWTDVTPSAGWRIEYGPIGFTQGTGTMAYTTYHPFNIGGLDTLSGYDFYVRPVCSSTDSADWTGPVSLYTSLCDSSFTVSTGNATGTTYYAPVNNLYEYGLTEVIITSQELTGIGDIEKIGFYYNHSVPMTGKDSVKMYLQPTTVSSFQTNSAIIPLDENGVLVYSGSLNCSQGWNYFTLDNPYTWNGATNLVLIIDDNSFAANTTQHTFSTAPSSGYKTICYYSADYNINPANPSQYIVFKSRFAQRPVLQLVSCGVEPCPKPFNLHTTTVSENSATVVWSGNGSEFEVTYKEDAADVWNSIQTVTTTGLNGSLTLTGLDENTTYSYRIRQVCSEGLQSDWVYSTFTTTFSPCPAPTGISVSDINYTSAAVDWSCENENAVWKLHVWSGALDTVYQAASHPFTLTGLLAGIHYKMQIATLCNASGNLSQWSDTIAFTTTVCDSVSNVQVNTITSSTASVSWQSTGAASYTIDYGPAGFLEGFGTQVDNISGTSFTISDLTPETAYDVYVRAQCAAGAYSTWSHRVTFTTSQQGINLADGMQVTIYPNPTSTHTTIALNGITGKVSLQIVDLGGRIVFSEQVTCQEDCTKRLDVSGLAPGAYFVHIAGPDVNNVQRLIVK